MSAAQINNSINWPGCYLSLALTYHILAFYSVQWYWLLCKVTLSCHDSLSSKLSINLKRGITIMIIHQPLCTCITTVTLFHIIISAPSTGLRTTELINSWVAPDRWKSVQDYFRLFKNIMLLKRGITIMIIHQPLCTCITNVNLFHIIIPAPSTGLRTTELINSWVAPERWKSVQDHFRLYKSIMSLKLRTWFITRACHSYYPFTYLPLAKSRRWKKSSIHYDTPLLLKWLKNMWNNLFTRAGHYYIRISMNAISLVSYL